MLWNRQYDAASGGDRAKHLGQDGMVFLDVLEDVVGADHLELLLERDLPGIHLVQGRSRHVRGRVLQSLLEYFTAADL